MNRVLMIVDMQKGFINKEVYKDLQVRLNEYIKKSDYDTYIFTKFKNKKDSLYIEKLQWDELLSTDSQEICVDVPKNSVVFEKYGYGLSQTQVEEVKKLMKGEREIDICGLQTDVCVYAIAFQMFDNGIFPNILINYVATSVERIETSKDMLIHQFGQVDERK